IVLEEMMKQIERDEKLGSELMKDKVKRKKKKNIEEEGPDAKLMEKYKNNSKYKDIMWTPSNEDQVDDDCPDDAIQCDVIRISDGGMNLKKDKFFSKAHPPATPN